MELQNRLKLSYYREIGTLDENHGVKLVQHVESRRVFVMKTLKIYDSGVYQYLAHHPVPGLPRIYEAVEDEGQLWVVEEYISGRSLRSVLTKGPMEPQQAIELVWKLGRILEPLHRLQPPIVNRDIKPENILITEDGRVMLVDFNSAREDRREAARDTVLIGTAGYAAPEQYGFSPSGPEADVYALGVLLSELLTGVRPEEGRYRGQLRGVVERCLQMDPANRYADGGQLADALEPWMQPPEEEKTSIWQRLREWMPPGFRSGNPMYALLAVIWYTFFVTVSCSAEFDGAVGIERAMNSILAILLFLGETLWVGNYRDVWRWLPLSRSEHLWIRLAGVALWAAVIGASLAVVGVGVLTTIFA